MSCAVGRSARLGLALAVALVAVLFSPRAHAHQAGLSHGRYTLRGESLAIDLVFSIGELVVALPAIDRDHDGAIDSRELADARPLFATAVVAPLTIVADGAACTSALSSVALTESDGASLHVEATCPTARHVVVHCGFLDTFSSTHRHFALLDVAEGAPPRETIAVASSPDLVLDAADRSPSSSQGSSFGALVRLGVEHILTGTDHLVFLFGLVVVGGRVRSLVAALTAFTVAHSLSLALATLGLWAPSPSIVEPAIALSIAFVGAENLWHGRKNDDAYARDPARRRWRITFPFGLIHGFGFAGALVEIGLPRARIPAALFAFNLGVELGQLAVLLVALPILAWARRYAIVRGPILAVANVAVVIAGIAWFVARVRG